MIAAQAIVHHASLVTMNASDYADIPHLSLVPW
jgi:predicted nucleic acid-binding protein